MTKRYLARWLVKSYGLEEYILQTDLILAQFVFLFLTEKLQRKWMFKLSMLLKKKQTNKQIDDNFHGPFST